MFGSKQFVACAIGPLGGNPDTGAFVHALRRQIPLRRASLNNGRIESSENEAEIATVSATRSRQDIMLPKPKRLIQSRSHSLNISLDLPAIRVSTNLSNS
jgi:hypothetical protein